MKPGSPWVLLITLLILASFLAACAAPDSDPAPASTPSMETETPSAAKDAPPALLNGGKEGQEVKPDSEAALKEPNLSGDLKRGGAYSSAQKGFSNVGLHAGELAVAFHLRDIDGKEFSISRLLAEKPVVLVFGSFT